MVITIVVFRINERLTNMNAKELKEKLADVPDDVEVNMLEEGGYLIDIKDAFLEQEIDNRIFVISH